jgi:hypothetical protein
MIVLIVLSLKAHKEKLKMSGRGEIECSRCKELKRKDKMVLVQFGKSTFEASWLCKHCKAFMITKLRQLEQVALED